MESEGSVQCSQGLTTGFYPETNQSSSHSPALFP
jgi:hypothetical protein